MLAAADNDGGKAGRGHMLTLTVKSNAMRIRDVNESRETRDANCFLCSRKGISRIPRVESG